MHARVTPLTRNCVTRTCNEWRRGGGGYDDVADRTPGERTRTKRKEQNRTEQNRNRRRVRVLKGSG